MGGEEKTKAKKGSVNCGSATILGRRLASSFKRQCQCLGRSGTEATGQIFLHKKSCLGRKICGARSKQPEARSSWVERQAAVIAICRGVVLKHRARLRRL